MVLEALLNPFTLKRKPWQMFLGGFFFSIMGLMLSYIVFREVSGILMVFFVVLSTLPMIYTTIKKEDVKFKTQKPILLKIAPDLNTIQLDEVIEIINKTNIEGVIATNTSICRDGLKASDEMLNAIGYGGLSGKPLTQKSTEIIKYIVEKSNKSIPVIGVGGIMTVEDAIEKLNAGASLIQIFTGFIYNGPGFVKEINKEILKQKQ